MFLIVFVGLQETGARLMQYLVLGPATCHALWLWTLNDSGDTQCWERGEQSWLLDSLSRTCEHGSNCATSKLRIDNNIKLWETESTWHGDIVEGGNLLTKVSGIQKYEFEKQCKARYPPAFLCMKCWVNGDETLEKILQRPWWDWKIVLDRKLVASLPASKLPNVQVAGLQRCCGLQVWFGVRLHRSWKDWCSCDIMCGRGSQDVIPWCFQATYKTLQVEPGKPGAEVSKKKTISQRKNLPIECAQGDQPLRCPNRVFWVNEPSAVPWWWYGDLFWCGWLPGEIRNFVVGCEMTRGKGMWLVARCHVMSCDVIWCVFILCDAISCVVWCHVMHCDVMWCPLMWWAVICCEVMRCNGMRSYEFVMRCGWLRCHVVWFEVVVWGELEDDLVIRATQIYSVLHSTTKYYSSTTLYYKVLHRTTKCYSSTILYYKVLLQYYSVLHSTIPVLLCTTIVLQSTTPVLLCTTKIYKVLLQYYSVLHSTILQYYKVLFCTTKYYSSTTPYCTVLLQYYKVLLQYYKLLLQHYSVLHSTTPVLLRTTKYYSSATLYYKVLLQYYSALQSTTPVLRCTTKYYSSTTLYYKVLLRYYSLYYKVLICKARSTNVTKCCACHAKWLSWLILVTYETWNVIYNAQSNRTHPPTSPNTAPATQNDSHEWCPSHMKRHLQCAEQQVSYTKITKCCACHEKWNASLILVTFEMSFTMRGEQQDSSSNVTKSCACHEKWLASLILVTYETSFTMRGATGVIHQRHQVLCLPRKMTRIIDPRDIWNVIFVQCAEQQASPSNLAKYCACHETWVASLILVTYETSFTKRGATGITLQPHQILRLPRKIALQNLRKICRKQLKRHFQCVADSTMIRTWSEHDPTMKLQNWTRPFAELTFQRILYTLKIATFRAPAIYPDFTEHWHCACHEKWHSKITKYCACHAKWLSWLMSVAYETSFTMRGATSLILQRHQILHLPRKMALMIDPPHIWNVIYNARGNRAPPPTSPNTGPATQNDSHEWCPSHMKRHLQCAEQQVSSSNVTKYSSHLPRKMTLMIDPPHIWNVIYNARSNRTPPPTSPSTVPATQNDSHEWCPSHLKRHLQCAEQQDSSSNVTPNTGPATQNDSHEWCPSHMKRHLQCAEQQVSSSNVTEYSSQLPRKMTLMIDPPHIWNVIYNARSNRTPPPTSPSTVPATQNDSHEWCPSHIKRHLQCAEEQASPSNLTKYCACHAKLHSKI